MSSIAHRSTVAITLGALVVAAAPLLTGNLYYLHIATLIAVYWVLISTLNLLVGYTGLVSFGHAAYFGIGAYTTGLLMKKLAVPFLLAFPAAGLLVADPRAGTEGVGAGLLDERERRLRLRECRCVTRGLVFVHECDRIPLRNVAPGVTA